jgi:hypothetical protein
MKWIFALLFLFPLYASSVESVPAEATPVETGQCQKLNNGSPSATLNNVSIAQCLAQGKIWDSSAAQYSTRWLKFGISPNHGYDLQVTIGGNWYGTNTRYVVTSVTNTYTCPPVGKPTFTIGPVTLNGAQVCQVAPKVCMMGAIVRVDKDGKETCVPNCSSAAGLTHTSQYFFQAGPDPASTVGNVACYGQCSIKTMGGTQLASGAWTGNFAFTGANCSVVRPEPTVDSESNTSGNGSATPVDESTTSPGTTDALGQLNGAASSATGTPVQPTVTGPDGTATLKDVTKTIADAANAQIKATSAQNVATGNLISNTNKDLQNTIVKTMGGGGGAAATLQAQGNGKLDGIGSAIGTGNGKLDGIQSTLNDIADKLDEPGEETPFVPGAGSGAFWENVLPESAFTEIKEKQADAIQEMKDLAAEFQSSVQMTDLSASGEPDEWALNMHGTVLPFGVGAFQLMLNLGLAALILFICALYAIYLITNRK